jgi:multidrug efflux pump subunit AcrA (membrane-fusion protein)
LAERSLVSELELEMREAQLDGAEASTAQAVARVEQARATADERRSALGKSVIRAPVSGRVGQRNAEVGMLADRSTLLFVIGNLDRVRIEVPITENMLGFLRAGQEVRIRAAGLGEEPRSAKLSRVSPFLTENSFSTIGEIDVDNRDGALHPGMFISVDVLYGESRQATLVPSSALWEDPQSGVLGIYVITGLGRADGTLSTSTGPSSTRPSSKMPTSGANPLVSEVSTQTHPVAFRPVKVLAEGRGSAGVEGLDEGEWVVTVGQHLLQQDRGEAFVRTTTWERVLELQGLQREDMLRDFLEQQQFLARHRGTAVLPPLGEMTEIASLTASRVGEAAQGANL